MSAMLLRFVAFLAAGAAAWVPPPPPQYAFSVVPPPPGVRPPPGVPRVCNNYIHHHQPKRWIKGYMERGRSPRVRTGEGRFLMLPGSAELICEFPPPLVLLSNVVWERADLGNNHISLDRMYKWYGETKEYVVQLRPHGSSLKLFGVSPLDKGIYRCMATALDPETGRMATLFQDVHFYPNI